MTYCTTRGNLIYFKEKEMLKVCQIQITIKLICVCLVFRNNLRIHATSIHRDMYSAGNISNEIKTNDNKKEIPYRSSQNFQSNRRQNINNTAWQINKQQNQDIIKATTTNIKHHNIRPSTTTSNVQQQQQQQRQEYLKQKRNDTTNFAYNLQHYDKKEIDLKNFEISCGYKREFYDDNMKRKSSSVLSVKKAYDNFYTTNIMNSFTLNETIFSLHRALDNINKFCNFLKQLTNEKNHRNIINYNNNDNNNNSNRSLNINNLITSNHVKDGKFEANNKQITFDLLRNITQRGKPLYDKQLTFLKDDSTPHHTHKNSSSTRTLFTVASDAEYNNIHEGRKLKKVKKKYRKFLFPLLMAYKLKFFTLIPVLIAGLTLLVTTTGLAGFFFALFTAVMTLRGTGGGGGKAVVVQEY